MPAPDATAPFPDASDALKNIVNAMNFLFLKCRFPSSLTLASASMVPSRG